MNTKTTSRKWSWIQLSERRAARTARLLLLLLLALPAVVQAQSYTNNYGTWTYAITNGAITITGYSGPGGDVIIPDRIPDTTNGLPVISIGDSAFEGCGSLSSVIIPNNVTSIGDMAFCDCGSLTNVTIDNSVISIGIVAFGACSSLTAITVDTRNSEYSDLDGILFDKGQTTLIQCPGGKVGSYTIPNSVTSIGDAAFLSCASLTSVTIPDSVTSIEDYAFCGCSSLTSVTIPSSVTSIGEDAFDGCTSLTSVTIPNSVTNIGAYAFCDCTRLASVTIPDSVTSIGNWTFAECSSLTNVTIPNSVTSIGWGAFGECTSLTSITIPNSVASIVDWAFDYCTILTGVYFQGNAPSFGSDVFFEDNATVYYLPGTTGWSDFAANTVLPVVLWLPQVQTSDASFGVRTNQCGFTINWASGMTVVVEASTNLANPVWYPLATNTLTSGSSYFSDPQRANYPSRFYRLRSP